MEREIADIADGLHANAIRITGEAVERIVQAGEIAARRGLEVWLSPMLPNADAATTEGAIVACARAAEELRRNGAKATLVIGCELSVFMTGIMPGATHGDRLALLADPARLMAEVVGAGLDPQARVRRISCFGRSHSARAVRRADQLCRRTVGAGRLVHLRRGRHRRLPRRTNRDGYRTASAGRLANGRPVVATETGCATYRGAPDAGGMGWAVIERTPRPKLRDGIVRDEAAQATEVGELLDVMESSGLDGRVRLHVRCAKLPSDPIPPTTWTRRRSRSSAAGPTGRTEPKAAYHAVAERYGAS